MGRGREWLKIFLEVVLSVFEGFSGMGEGEGFYFVFSIFSGAGFRARVGSWRFFSSG